MKIVLMLFAFVISISFCFAQNFTFPLSGVAVNGQLPILTSADGVVLVTTLRSEGCTPGPSSNFQYSTSHLSTGAIYRNTSYSAGCGGSKDIIKMDFSTMPNKPLGMQFSVLDVDNGSDSVSVEIYSAGSRVHYTYFLYNPTFVTAAGASPSFGFYGSASNNSTQDDDRGSIDITTVDPYVRIDSILVHKYNNRDVAGNPSQSIAKFSWSSIIVLPVKMLSISATIQNEKIYCKWSVAEEQNISSYQIEYSSDGSAFYKIGAATAAKNINSVVQQYDFVINNPLPNGTIFLRLLITDFDGKKSYSKVLKLADSKSFNFSVFPTLFSDLIHVSYDTESRLGVDFQLVGIEGRIHFRKRVIVEKGSNSLQFALPANLPSGIYIFKAVSENGESQSRRVVKI